VRQHEAESKERFSSSLTLLLKAKESVSDGTHIAALPACGIFF
jgi:hypothetical protein